MATAAGARQPSDSGVALRDATRINDSLGRLGYTTAQITAWWNAATIEERAGETPLRLWQAADYGPVRRLIDELMRARADEADGAVPLEEMFAKHQASSTAE